MPRTLIAQNNIFISIIANNSKNRELEKVTEAMEFHYQILSIETDLLLNYL